MKRPRPGSTDDLLLTLCRALGDRWPRAVDAIVPGCGRIPISRLPRRFAVLLDHRQHMTDVLERFYGRPVRLRVLSEHRDADRYTREIVLTLDGTDRPVEFGIARIDLAVLPTAVRKEIISRRAPLGAILAGHGILRRVEPIGFVIMEPACPWFRHLGGAARRYAYGRVARIHCGGRPAIELLEVVNGVSPE